MPDPKIVTVAQALIHASAYWEANEDTRSRRGCNMMPIRAAKGASILGNSRKLSSLTAADGVRLLKALTGEGLSRSTVVHYYGATRRMLALAGVPTVSWPKAPTPPRQPKEPIPDTEIDQLHDWLLSKGYDDTADLLTLMRDTGLRVEVEALNGEWEADGRRLRVVSGKGGHGRMVPYKGPIREPIRAQGGITYEGHLKRWKAGVRELGLRADFRPHDLRRHFVKRAYEGSGNDLRVAAALAGHSNVSTTAGYIGYTFEELENALA